MLRHLRRAGLHHTNLHAGSQVHGCVCGNSSQNDNQPLLPRVWTNFADLRQLRVRALQAASFRLHASRSVASSEFPRHYFASYLLHSRHLRHLHHGHVEDTRHGTAEFPG